MAEPNEIFRVMLRMRIRPGTEEEYERTWLKIGQVITDHPANIGQCLMRGDEDGIYYIVSDWADEARFREFERSAEHVEHREKLHPFRTGGEMWTMRMIYQMRGPAAS